MEGRNGEGGSGIRERGRGSSSLAGIETEGSCGARSEDAYEAREGEWGGPSEAARNGSARPQSAAVSLWTRAQTSIHYQRRSQGHPLPTSDSDASCGPDPPPGCAGAPGRADDAEVVVSTKRLSASSSWAPWIIRSRRRAFRSPSPRGLRNSLRTWRTTSARAARSRGRTARRKSR